LLNAPLTTKRMEKVSDRRLAETYDDGWAVVTEYRQAHTLHETDSELAYAEIARRVGRPPGTVRAWLVDDMQPRPVQAIETARAAGWLDIEPGTEQERALIAIVAWVYAGGGIGQKRFVPTFSADDTLAVVALDQLLGTVGVEYRINERSADGAYELVPQTGGAVFGRLLSCLGAPVGRKAELDTLALPSSVEEGDAAHRRLFARVYLFNRVVTSEARADYRIVESRTPGYLAALADLFEDLTGASVPVTEAERLELRAPVVDALCPGEPRRSALATQIAHGTVTPPSERAILSTFRPTDRPPATRYVRAYREMQSRDDPSPAAIATEYDITPGAVYGWRQGSVPKAAQLVADVRDRGWLNADEAQARADLAALAAWLVGFGSLRQTCLPVFRVRTAAQRRWLQTLTGRLALPTTVDLEDSPRTTEVRVTENATLLGRVLNASGVPTAGQDEGTLVPPYVWYYADGARAYVSTWVLLHGERHGAELRVGTANGAGDWVLRTIVALARERFDWPVEALDDEFRVTYEAARPTLVAALPESVVAQFEE